jgi:hypothetical protein
MNDVTKIPDSGVEIIEAGALSEPELIDKINNEHEQLIGCVVRGAQHALNVGQLLIEAKGKVAYGSWEEWVGKHCDFTPRMDRIYRKLAHDFAELGLRKCTSELSLTAAIKMIEELKSPDDPVGPKARNKKDPLEILKRAWGRTPDKDRAVFLREVAKDE